MAAFRTYNKIVAARAKSGWCVADADSGEVIITDLHAPEVAENAALALRRHIDDGEDVQSAVALTLDWLNGNGKAEPDDAAHAAREEESRRVEAEVLQAEREATCLCGCGAKPKKAGSRFMPGHDGRLKGDLLALARAGDRRAEARLEALGWGKFLATGRR